jgi:peptidoglycan/LPS O-acetylase OafA/YrhL
MRPSDPADGDPSWLWSGEIPSLNGLRAVAILCVIASHLFREGLPMGWEIGHFGVTAFFVISGFLITLLLLREVRRTGTASLRGFYLRRTLRIMPAYFTFLAAMACLQWAGAFHYRALDWATAVTYMTSFRDIAQVGHNLAHTWSLSVEEHFYLVWPVLFLALSPKRACFLLASYVAVIAPALRAAMANGYIPLHPSYSSPAQMSSIAAGCLFALIVGTDAAPKVRSFLFARTKWLPFAALALIAVGRILSTQLKLAFSDPVKAVAFSLLLAWLLITEVGMAQRFLNSRPMVWIGILSYSLYLWQQPLTESAAVPGGVPGKLVAVAMAATASYFLIETPFLRWKARIANAKRGQSETPSVAIAS